MRTSELIGPALDRAVWEAWPDAPETPLTIYGKGLWYGGAMNNQYEWRPSTDWSQGGPIIERERLHIIPLVNPSHGQPWECWTLVPDVGPPVSAVGPTPLVAAMRCFVASKLGEDVDFT